MAEQFAPTQDPLTAMLMQALGGGAQQPTLSATPQPMPVQPRPPAPVTPPLQAPGGGMVDMILQALSSHPLIGQFLAQRGVQTGPGFERAVQARNDMGIAKADEAIARMQQGNSAIRHMLSRPMGGQAPNVTAEAVSPSGAIDPLALFGGPSKPPGGRPAGPPTPQQVVAQAPKSQAAPLRFSAPGQPPPVGPQLGFR